MDRIKNCHSSDFNIHPILRQIRGYVDFICFKTIIQIFIFFKIHYYDSFFNNFSSSFIQLLQFSRSFAAKTILFYCMNLCWLLVQDRFVFKILLNTYKSYFYPHAITCIRYSNQDFLLEIFTITVNYHCSNCSVPILFM